MKTEIKSLNKLYDEAGLLYLCNAIGEVNDPNGDPLASPAPETVMTAEEQELYKLHDDVVTCGQYVVRRKEGGCGMALVYLISTEVVQDALLERGMEPSDDQELEDIYMEDALKALKEEAEILRDELPEGVELYVGDWTDPDGHELLVYVPYEMRAQKPAILQAIGVRPYDAIVKM